MPGDTEHETDEIAQIRWQILCACRQIAPAAPISLLRLLPGGISLENQRWFIEHCVDEPLAAYFPRGIDHERKLLRAVVLAAEADGQELSEELMSGFTRRLLLKSTSVDSQTLPGAALLHDTSFSYKIYAYSSPLLDISGTLRSIQAAEDRTLQEPPDGQDGGCCIASGDSRAGLIALHTSHDMLAGETGCFDWEAGFFLSEFIFSSGENLFKGRYCLELGSGVGMAGVALARVGAAAVLCTDGDRETLENCERNLRINGVRSPNKDEMSSGTGRGGIGRAGGEGNAVKVVSVQRLRWEDDIDELLIPRIDVIVGADLSYDPVNIPPLISIIKKLLRVDSTSEKLNNGLCQVENGHRNGAPCVSPDAVVYLATMKRNETTMQKFLDAVAREPRLVMVESTEEAMDMTAKGVRFCHIASLEAARDRLVLHKISAARL